MKTRNGFVSNSSSSSFVVAFKKKPTKHELLDLLFPYDKKDNRKGVTTSYGYIDNKEVDALSASNIIWKQLEKQKPLTKEQILEEIRSGWFDGHPDSSDRFRAEDEVSREYTEKTGKYILDKDADPVWKKKYDDAWRVSWNQYTKDIDAAAKVLFEKVWENDFKGKKCFRVSFSDGDGQVFSTLEHGNTFRNLPHIKISHH